MPTEPLHNRPPGIQIRNIRYVPGHHLEDIRAAVESIWRIFGTPLPPLVRMAGPPGHRLGQQHYNPLKTGVLGPGGGCVRDRLATPQWCVGREWDVIFR